MSWQWTFAYHPDHDLHIMIHTVVDIFIMENNCELVEDDTVAEERQLLAATFGERGIEEDVRAAIRDNIGNGRLQLFPPRPSAESYLLLLSPSIFSDHPTWWCVKLFGDPLPLFNEILRLEVEEVVSKNPETLFFSENTGVDIHDNSFIWVEVQYDVHHHIRIGQKIVRAASLSSA